LFSDFSIILEMAFNIMMVDRRAALAIMSSPVVPAVQAAP
jgi:hypothetical protein